MAKRDSATKSNRAAEKALESAKSNPAISDYRKESKTFQLVAGGGFTLKDTEDLCAALLSDYACGYLNGQDVDNYIKPVETVVKVRELELKLELIKKSTRRLPSHASPATLEGTRDHA